MIYTYKYQYELLNKSFWTVALRTQISILTSSRWQKKLLLKDKQFISSYFDTSFIEIHWQVLVIWLFQCLRIKFLKWHLSLMTGFNSHCSSQYCVCLYDRQIQIYGLVVWLLLLYVCQNVSLVDYTLHDFWSPWSVTLQSCRFEFGGHYKHTPVLAAVVDVNPVNWLLRCHFLTWYTSMKWPLSMDFNEWDVKMCRNNLLFF